MTNNELIAQLRQAGVDASAWPEQDYTVDPQFQRDQAEHYDGPTDSRPDIIKTPSASDFAPPSDPDRMKQIAKLSGDAFRQATTVANKALLDLIGDFKTMVAEFEKDALAYIDSNTDIGAFHADRIEAALLDLQSATRTLGAEREKLRGQKGEK